MPHRFQVSRWRNYLAPIDSLLKKIIQHGEFALSFAIHHLAQDPSDPDSPEYVVDFTGADADLLLERNGALLDALEHVVLKAARLREEHLGKITFDCQDWRRLRIEELKLTAQIAAERVVESGDPFALSPMNPRERRIIHLALRDRPRPPYRERRRGRRAPSRDSAAPLIR